MALEGCSTGANRTQGIQSEISKLSDPIQELIDFYSDLLEVVFGKRREQGLPKYVVTCTTDYECSREEFCAFTDNRLKPPKHQSFLTLDQATERLEAYLALPKPTLGTSLQLARLNRFFNSSRQYSWGFDVVFRAFQDLDTLFFASELYGHVEIHWTHPEYDANKEYLGCLEPAYQNSTEVPGKSVIKLVSKPLLFEGPARTAHFVIEILLHEMIVSFTFMDTKAFG